MKMDAILGKSAAFVGCKGAETVTPIEVNRKKTSQSLQGNCVGLNLSANHQRLSKQLTQVSHLLNVFNGNVMN